MAYFLVFFFVTQHFSIWKSGNDKHFCFTESEAWPEFVHDGTKHGLRLGNQAEARQRLCKLQVANHEVIADGS